MRTSGRFRIIVVVVAFYSVTSSYAKVNCTANSSSDRRVLCPTSEHDLTRAQPQPTNKVNWKPKWRPKWKPKKKSPPKKSNEPPYPFFEHSLNETADPCHDFYNFACGNYVFNHPTQLPTDAFGITNHLEEEVKKQHIELIMRREPTHSRAIEKMRVYMKKCLDTESIRTKGTIELWASMQAIGQGFPMLSNEFNPESFDLEDTLIKMIDLTGEDFLFKIGVLELHTKEMNLIFGVADLITPSIRVYLATNIKESTALHDYLVFIISQIARAHRPEIELLQIRKEVESLLDYEKGLAKILANSQVYKPAGENKRMPELKTMSDLKSTVTIINWDRFLQNHPLIAEELRPFLRDALPIYLYTERVLREVDEYHKAADKRVLANYLFVQLLVTQVPYMDQKFINAANLFAEQLGGLRHKSERKDKCYNEALRFFPLVSDHVYAKEHLKKETITTMNQMIEQLRHAMVSMLESKKWMGRQTRNNAVKKMKKMRKIIGIVDDAKDEHKLDKRYEGIHLATSDSYHSMSVKLKKYVAQAELMHWLDPDVPLLLPGRRRRSTEVNAYHYHTENLIYIAAATLQPPLLVLEEPAAVNYGAMGFIVGHEMMHGFERYGLEHDEDGKYRDWWDSKSKRMFDERETCFIEQYNKQVESKTRLHVNGTLTINENVADNGGIRAAFKAYKRYLKGKHERHVSGYEHYSNAQTFFIAFATSRCSSKSRERLEYGLKTLPHAPDQTRVNVALSNFPEFAKAFKCRKGTKMNPRKRCTLW